MSAWKSSVAVVIGAAAMAAAHTGALIASGNGFKALTVKAEDGFLREAHGAPAEAEGSAGMTGNSRDTQDPIASPSRQKAASEWPASGSLAGKGAYFAPTLRFRPGAGGLELAFGIDEGGPVTLEAFDARGNLVATLLDGERAAGFHRLFLFSNRLQGKTGQVFFRLRAGAAVLAEMRAASR